MPLVFRRSVPIAAVFYVSVFAADASETSVVASIKPVHSLVAAVMKGVAYPYLLVKGAGSPHAYSLKPSDANALERADAVFWIGDQMETFLQGSIGNLSKNARSVKLSAAHAL